MTAKSKKNTLKGDLVKLAQLFNDFNDTATRVMMALDLEGKEAGYCTDLNVFRIQQTVAEHYGFSIAVMTSKQRPNNMVEPRHVAIALCAEFTSLTNATLGNCFNRHHSGITHAQTAIRNRVQSDADFKKKYGEVRLLVESKLTPTPKLVPALPLQFLS